jgi:hypothetical protein
VKLAKAQGAVFVRSGNGDHEVWLGPNGKKFVLDKGGKSRHTFNSALKDGGIDGKV